MKECYCERCRMIVKKLSGTIVSECGHITMDEYLRDDE